MGYDIICHGFNGIQIGKEFGFMIPEREIFWNIGPWGSVHIEYIIYPLAAITVGILIYAIYRRYRLWRLGKPEVRWEAFWQRIGSFIKLGIIDAFFHRRFFGFGRGLGIKSLLPRDPLPGIMHFLILAGAGILMLGAFWDFISHYWFGFVQGNFYLGMSLAVDIGGIFIIISVIIALVRRYVLKVARLDNVLDDVVVLGLILAIVISGYVLEGFRITATASPADWAQWSFVGYGLANLFKGVGTAVGWYTGLWWFHIVLVLGGAIYLCFALSKLSHIIFSPVNVFFHSLRPKGALVAIDLEKTETFGVGKIEDFTWKQLLDLDACTRCGRCEENCPAHLSGKSLSPKQVIQNLKDYLTQHGGQAGETNGAALIGEVITEEEIWDCTTCRTCQEVCPVYIEHIDKIIDLRRNLVLEQGSIPETAEGVLRSIEARGHSCRGTTHTRTEWTEGLGIKTLAEDSDVEVLYWTGCQAALEDRNIKVAIAFANLLQSAGVKFGILGDEESCCGEPARRLGNEYLFQIQAQRNIETLKNYGVKKIVTACPHCFNTLKNEYPQFGGDFEVIHHSQFILELIEGGRLELTKRLNKKVTYHDPCYLGRYNGIYEPPRGVLNSISMLKLVEMERGGIVKPKDDHEWEMEEKLLARVTGMGKEMVNNIINQVLARIPGIKDLEEDGRKAKGFCCGGGGGHFWIEEKVGQRISEMRTEDAINTQAEVIAVACPFCMQMFEDGIKAKGAEEHLQAMDLAELIAQVI
jgi:Fe-S oxidoreductase/nitrate reductase gamma subunit